MTGTSPSKSQPDIFRPLLTDFIDTDHELAVLADRIEWDYFEDAFAGHYSHTGQPAMPIRFMVGYLLLKRIYDYGDETLAKVWVMNPYMWQSYLLGALLTVYTLHMRADGLGRPISRPHRDSFGIKNGYFHKVMPMTQSFL